MKTVRLITGTLLALLVACAPQTRPPQGRPDKVSTPNAAEMQANKTREEANKEISKRLQSMPQSVKQADKDVIDLQVLGNILNVTLETNVKSEVEKVILTTHASDIVLAQDAQKKNEFTNKADPNAAQKYTVFIIKSENGLTEIVVFDELNGGRVNGTVSLTERFVKAEAHKNNANKILVQENDVREATEEEEKKINLLEKDLTGKATLSVIKLVTSNTNEKERNTVERKTLQVNKIVIATEQYNDSSVDFISETKLQNGTVLEVKSKDGQILIESEVDTLKVEILLKDDSVNQLEAALKIIG